MTTSVASVAMTASERQASISLASTFALRILGLFLVLPVFAIEAVKYPGGEDPTWVGFTMGVYGLTQGVLQIPFGMASDRWGRKRVILTGLAIFALGSIIAAAATSLTVLALGRAVQGAGAVSAAVTALLADLTRDEVRTRAMALVGMSIGLMFALSLVLAPILVARVGLPGLFLLTAVLTLGAMVAIVWWTPAEPALRRMAPRAPLWQVLSHMDLQRLNLGVFVLHAVQLAMWVAIPGMLVRAGLPKAEHWRVYLPTVLASFVVMGATLFPLERRGKLKSAFIGSICTLVVVQAGLWVLAEDSSLWGLAFFLFVFFCAFNVLEASQPSLATRVAPDALRGTALGVYNTLQSLGFFVGGLAGGALLKASGEAGVFAACAALLCLWLASAWFMSFPGGRRRG